MWSQEFQVLSQGSEPNAWLLHLLLWNYTGGSPPWTQLLSLHLILELQLWRGMPVLLRILQSVWLWSPEDWPHELVIELPPVDVNRVDRSLQQHRYASLGLLQDHTAARRVFISWEEWQGEVILRGVTACAMASWQRPWVVRQHGTYERPSQEAKHLKSWDISDFWSLELLTDMNSHSIGFSRITTRVVKNTTMIVLVMMVAWTGSDVTPENVNCNSASFRNPTF